MYYLIVIAAVWMFGIQFLMNQKYENESGSDTASSMFMIFTSSLVGALVLLVFNKFKIGCTLFTFIMSVITAINSIACTFCGLRALNKSNLSVFSLFSMLGGMILPFVAGILFFDEDVTAGKILCLITIVLALVVTVNFKKKDEGKIYHLGIFIFNGMSGVLSKVYQDYSFPKSNEASYSVLSALICAIIAAIFLLCLKSRTVHKTKYTAVWVCSSGALNKVANLLLLIGLVHLPASVQYPMTTCGVIIVSTAISFFTNRKPEKRELLSVALAFIGILFLFI